MASSVVVQKNTGFAATVIDQINYEQANSAHPGAPNNVVNIVGSQVANWEQAILDQVLNNMAESTFDNRFGNVERIDIRFGSGLLTPTPANAPVWVILFLVVILLLRMI